MYVDQNTCFNVHKTSLLCMYSALLSWNLGNYKHITIKYSLYLKYHMHFLDQYLFCCINFPLLHLASSTKVIPMTKPSLCQVVVIYFLLLFSIFLLLFVILIQTISKRLYASYEWEKVLSCNLSFITICYRNLFYLSNLTENGY